MSYSRNPADDNAALPARILSKSAEKRVGAFYSGSKFAVAGAFCGLAIVESYEKISANVVMPSAQWIAMFAGAIVFVWMVRHFHVD
jgi:hypothetical protein